MVEHRAALGEGLAPNELNGFFVAWGKYSRCLELSKQGHVLFVAILVLMIIGAVHDNAVSDKNITARRMGARYTNPILGAAPDLLLADGMLLYYFQKRCTVTTEVAHFLTLENFVFNLRLFIFSPELQRQQRESAMEIRCLQNVGERI